MKKSLVKSRMKSTIRIALGTNFGMQGNMNAPAIALMKMMKEKIMTKKKTTTKSAKIKTDKGLFEHVHESGFNPGSSNAMDMGCECPVLDNSFGKGSFSHGDGTWWMNANCPIHGNKSPI